MDYRQLKEMQKTFEAAVSEIESGRVYDRALKECGRVHLSNCISRTPYGHYPSKTVFVKRVGGDGLPFVFPIHPRKGGTLKKGWVVETHEQASAAPGIPSSAEIRAMVSKTPVRVNGRTRSMTFYNRVKYALWVDKGHRLCHPAGAPYGFVAPRNYIRNAENETARQMPAIIGRHIRRALQGHRGGTE